MTNFVHGHLDSNMHKCCKDYSNFNDLNSRGRPSAGMTANRYNSFPGDVGQFLNVILVKVSGRKTYCECGVNRWRYKLAKLDLIFFLN